MRGTTFCSSKAASRAAGAGLGPRSPSTDPAPPSPLLPHTSLRSLTPAASSLSPPPRRRRAEMKFPPPPEAEVKAAYERLVAFFKKHLA